MGVAQRWLSDSFRREARAVVILRSSFPVVWVRSSKLAMQVTGLPTLKSEVCHTGRHILRTIPRTGRQNV